MCASECYEFGRVQINNNTHVSVTICMMITCCGTPRATEIPMTAMIEIVAARFAFRLIAPLLFQSWIIGPNVLCDINQPCSRLDDFAKQKEASKTSGTVGTSGRTTPAIPTPSAINPADIQKNRIIRMHPICDR